MDWEQATRQRLIDGVAPETHWTERPENTPLPAIVLRLISDPRPQTLKGFEGRRESRVQLDCLGADRATVVALREAAIATLAPAAAIGGVGFGRSFFELTRSGGSDSETGFVHRESIDALIWHD